MAIAKRFTFIMVITILSIMNASHIASANFIDNYFASHEVCSNKFPGVGVDAYNLYPGMPDLYGKPPIKWTDDDLQQLSASFDRCQQIAASKGEQLDFFGKVKEAEHVVNLARESDAKTRRISAARTETAEDAMTVDADIVRDILREQIAKGKKCYDLYSDDTISDADKNKFCVDARRRILSGVNSDFYKKIRYTVCPFHEHIIDPKRVFDEWSVADMEMDDVFDILRATLECIVQKNKTDNGVNGFIGFDQSLAVDMVYKDILQPSIQARQRRDAQSAFQAQRELRQAQIAAEQERRRKMIETANKEKVARLAGEGYVLKTVVDLQVEGNSLIGAKVVVNGYVQDFDASEAKVFAHPDDTNGVSIDISEGDIAVRRFIVGNCSSLTRNCRVEFKAHVINDDGKIGLKLD